ncbi:MAG: NADH-quinone oxidoreductase subunit F [Cycloclasticus sp. symbiont of Bathymodiolus heckerae]|nr:MAG: NADH-quinone oxidoreductase subunit F [Cycloclasticus sp. symbiont of Bathymodiolus heckerae]
MSDNLKKNIRPGNKKKRKGRFFERGRQLNASAQTDISTLLRDKPRQKDLLIEYLHLIQDKWSHISAAHLLALAHELKLSQADVYEVATFYHHFDVIKESQSPPATLTVRVCNSLSCCMAGADELLNELSTQTIDNTRITSAPCMGLCNQAPAVAIGKNYIGNASAQSVRQHINDNNIAPIIPNYQTYSEYTTTGGYSSLRSLTEQTLSIEQAIQTLESSNLQGLGGAGFPTAKKLRIVKDEPSPRYFCVNADEGEPGTFKDRHYLSTTPHQFLEGMLIAAHIIDASKIYIYLRDEYAAIYSILQNEIHELTVQEIIAKGFVEIRRGAGAYICGEESAMIESIEGKRGIPRHRPPYVAQQGLFNRPTLVQNVETLYWIPTILNKGAQWFEKQGANGSSGLRTFSLSGRIKKPGIIIAPAGSTVSTLIELAGGMLEGHSFKAYLPGGASGGLLPASLAHLPLDFGNLTEYGCFVGSHAVIILSDRDSIKTTSQNLLNFFQHESCGQCTPCRIGCEKASALLSEEQWNKPLLTELCTTMADTSICGLGQAAPNPIMSSIKYFPDDV